MTKSETRKLTNPVLFGRMRRGKKTPEYRERQGMFLIGCIQTYRDLAQAFKSGNEAAQLFAELCEYKEAQATQALRKL